MGSLRRSDAPEADADRPARAGGHARGSGEAVRIVGRPIRVGVVGIGFGQAAHVPAFRSEARCAVVAIAASSSARAARVAERLGVPRAYGDWRALVDAPDIDLVSVAVPPVLQPEIVMAVAASSRPVFCEKPVAADAAVAERMLAAVRSAGIATAVDLEFAELPAWRELKRLIAGGAIGRARASRVAWHVRTRPRPADSWKARPDVGGGAMGGFASHLLYLIEWALGRVERLSAHLGQEAGRSRVEAHLQTVDGCACDIEVATDAPEGTGLNVRIEGDRGVIELAGGRADHVRGYALSVSEGRAARRMVCDDPPLLGGDARVGAVASVVARFIDRIEGGGRMRPDLGDGVRLQHLLDALVAADGHGGWVVP